MAVRKRLGGKKGQRKDFGIPGPKSVSVRAHHGGLVLPFAWMRGLMPGNIRPRTTVMTREPMMKKRMNNVY